MIYEKSELVDLYRGVDNLPGQWRTVEEISTQLSLDPGEIRFLFEFYGIEERGSETELRRVVWEILANEWFMEFENDFNYMVQLFSIQIQFHLPAEGLGINLDTWIPPKTMIMNHIHGVNIYRLNPDIGMVALQEEARKILKDNRVSKRSRFHGKAKGQGVW